MVLYLDRICQGWFNGVLRSHIGTLIYVECVREHIWQLPNMLLYALYKYRLLLLLKQVGNARLMHLEESGIYRYT